MMLSLSSEFSNTAGFRCHWYSAACLMIPPMLYNHWPVHRSTWVSRQHIRSRGQALTIKRQPKLTAGLSAGPVELLT